MSLQVCSCGWSKVTSYHGLRTHQGKMGCTPKGARIPREEQDYYQRNQKRDQRYTWGSEKHLGPDVYEGGGFCAKIPDYMLCSIEKASKKKSFIFT